MTDSRSTEILPGLGPEGATRRTESVPSPPWILTAALLLAGALGTWGVSAGLDGRFSGAEAWIPLTIAVVLLLVAARRLVDGQQSAAALRQQRDQIRSELEDVRSTAETLRIAIEAAPCGIVMVDAEGRLVRVNSETERLFGYSRDEMLGRSVEMLVPHHLREVHRGHRQDFMACPAARLMGGGRDLYGVRKNGEEFPVEVGLNPIVTSGGTFVFGAVTDITARIRSEAELVRQTEELKRSNAELEQFAYVASHDLQEPLRMVASFTGLLADRYREKLDERADQYIHYALDGSKRMQQLIRDLLAYSRINSQARPLVEVDVSKLVNEVLRDLSTALEEVEAEIEVADLPVVRADESQLRQVFANLLSNALKFRSDQAPRIRVSVRDVEGTWQFTVSDNGIGIDPAYEQRVFQMFQRLHEREKYEGSGIGLAISKRIVERHGGKIWFESLPDGGTSFHFTLPSKPRESLDTGTYPRPRTVP